MFDRIGWIHISDLHLESGAEAWSQDVVLRALHQAILDRKGRRPVHFIVATGDLAYSGQADQYERVGRFFDAITKASGLNREALFHIPGNHDNDLSKQKYSVLGARTASTSLDVDELISDDHERDQILLRQANYRHFAEQYAPYCPRTYTAGQIAYISLLELAHIRIALVGLNSSWTCLSGKKDEQATIMGERQVIDAIELVKGLSPHFVIGLMHHPLNWLRNFEQEAIEDRLYEACDFIHRGHLHEARVHVGVAAEHQCITVAAGASYETRTSQNSFSYIEIDIGTAQCTVTPLEYPIVPGSGSMARRQHRCQRRGSCAAPPIASSPPSLMGDRARPLLPR
jgi:predicted phosphodiesterase